MKHGLFIIFQINLIVSSKHRKCYSEFEESFYKFEFLVYTMLKKYKKFTLQQKAYIVTLFYSAAQTHFMLQDFYIV